MREKAMDYTLMYITNDPEVAKIAEENGVDWIFVDLEYLGKVKRQGHLDTVISKHSIEDVRNIRKALCKSSLMVRCNPIHENSFREIEEVLASGADILMLPFYKTVEEVSEFIRLINGRAKVCLLLETPEAVEILDDILIMEGIDYIHIGLNDLSLGYGFNFMFEPMANGLAETICAKIKNRSGIRYGIGGISQLGKGDLSADLILGEHIFLGSSMAILSRSFCDVRKYKKDQIYEIFSTEVRKIRDYICNLQEKDKGYFLENRKELQKRVNEIKNNLKAKKELLCESNMEK